MQKQETLHNFTHKIIDKPIADLINGFNELPCCFTLQSCYGHFVCNSRTDPHNLDPLPSKDIISRIKCRLAYIAFCIENSLPGRELLELLKGITAADPENIQFCCAEWFWKLQVNSYALQVEPDRLNLPATSCGECARYSVQV